MTNYKIKIIGPNSQKGKSFLKNVILPKQTHSDNIVEIKTGEENLQNCDGLITSNKNNFTLGVQTADCAAICFYDDKKYGVIHAGWRGLVNGIVEKTLKHFNKPKIFVSPLLKEFEIQKDDCFERIKNKFGEKYFYIRKTKSGDIIIFKFSEALKSLLPRNAVFDPRDTFKTPSLASWRRDRNKQKANYTLIYKINQNA